MFDISFSELVVIGLVALIVIGPERLPKVARTAGLLLGRLQRYVNDVKADIQREMQLEELKRLQEKVAEQAKAIENSVTHELREAGSALEHTIAAPVGGAVAEAEKALTAAPANEPMAPPAAQAAAADSPSQTEPGPDHQTQQRKA